MRPDLETPDLNWWQQYHLPEVGSVIPVPNTDVKSSLHFLLNFLLNHDTRALILLDSALVSSIRMTYDQMSICQKTALSVQGYCVQSSYIFHSYCIIIWCRAQILLSILRDVLSYLAIFHCMQYRCFALAYFFAANVTLELLEDFTVISDSSLALYRAVTEFILETPL